jgi:hypothetical protein
VNRKRSRCTAAMLGVALRRTTPVRGAPIMVSRIEELSPSIPPGGPGGPVVLGLVDAPVAVKAIAA